MHNFSFAFTLPEILVTLVIIGVISVITLPFIVQNTQKNEYVSKLKKAYSVLQQSTYKIAIKEGSFVGDFSFMLKDEFFNYFSEQLHVNKMCNADNEGCFYQGYSKTLKGDDWAIYDTAYSLVTSDGIAYNWNNAIDTPANCNNKGFEEIDKNNCIGRFVVDVNGDKSPNKFGRDIFFFGVIDGKGIVPAGISNKSADCKKNDRGITCAAKVLKENKMSY